jgi:hypothetical protein
MTVVSESGMMFLKFLDDLELQREAEAELGWKKFEPAFEPPYLWRDWSAKSDDITSDELQFTVYAVLKVPSFSHHDKRAEIIDKFGAADQLRKAVNQLQTPLYAA